MRNLTYLLLNLAFVMMALLTIRKLNPKPKPRPHLLLAGICLYFMMVIFNTYLTSLTIVRYDWQKLLGFKIISWPIEDLAYLVVALYTGPILWSFFYHRYEAQLKPTPQASSKKPARTKNRASSSRLKTD